MWEGIELDFGIGPYFKDEKMTREASTTECLLAVSRTVQFENVI